MFRNPDASPDAETRQAAAPDAANGRRPAARRSKALSPAALKRHGFRPATVVDVGVDAGTEALYSCFPTAELFLVEPLVESEPYMRELLGRRMGDYVLAAAGAEPGTATINVERRRYLSSIFDRTELVRGDAIEQRTIPVTTLDLLLEERGFSPPFGLKIDTEGFELEVIKGAQQFLRQTQFVLAEVSVAPRFHGSYRFAEFVAAMDDAGFGVCQVFNGGRVYVDMLFRPYGE